MKQRGSHIRISKYGTLHKMKNYDYSKVIPELPDWNEGKGIDVDSWICCVGSFEHAIGYSRLFWPEFIEYDGCIFFSDFSKKNYQGFLSSTKGDKTAVEVVMNHLHIIDLFCDTELEPTEEQIIYLGRMLKDMWQTKLTRDFPNKKVIVSFPEDDINDLLEYEITFFQEYD